MKRRHHNLVQPLLLLGSLLLCTSFSLFGASLTSSWIAHPTAGATGIGNIWHEQRDAVRLDHGWLFARNDNERLYLLIDLTGDTVEDRPKSSQPWGDFVAVAFDVDLNRRVSANKDLRYTQHPGSYRLGLHYYTGPGRFTGPQRTKAKLVAGFRASPLLQRRHRTWGLSIPLKEIDAQPGQRVLLAVETYSQQPRFSDKLPAQYLSELKGLIEIRLAAKPSLSILKKMSPQKLRKLVGKQRIIVRPNRELWPPHMVQPGASVHHPGLNQPPNCPIPEGEPIKRAILDDGTIELSFANGSKKQHTQGGWKILCPDGTPVPTQVLYSTQIPPTLPPTLPDETEEKWLEYHSMRLLGIISSMVNDDAMVENYLNTEPEDWSIYERIQKRSETISFLLAE